MSYNQLLMKEIWTSQVLFTPFNPTMFVNQYSSLWTCELPRCSAKHEVKLLFLYLMLIYWSVFP